MEVPSKVDAERGETAQSERNQNSQGGGRIGDLLVKEGFLNEEQLQKAQENFVPPEITEMLQSLDLKLHRMEKRLEEVEDQLIRPVEEVIKQ